MTTDTPSDLVKRLRAMPNFWLNGAAWIMMTEPAPLGVEAADRIEAVRQRIVELEKMLATESEVTLKFSEAIDRLERELAEARRMIKNLAPTGRYNGLGIEQWFIRAEKAERELAEARKALVSAYGVGYDENGWQDLARVALDMYGRKP